MFPFYSFSEASSSVLSAVLVFDIRALKDGWTWNTLLDSYPYDGHPTCALNVRDIYNTNVVASMPTSKCSGHHTGELVKGMGTQFKYV